MSNLIEVLERMSEQAQNDRARWMTKGGRIDESEACREAIETVRAMQEALYRLEEAAQDSNDAQYGTLSTRFVLDMIQPHLRRAEGNAG